LRAKLCAFCMKEFTAEVAESAEEIQYINHRFRGFNGLI